MIPARKIEFINSEETKKQDNSKLIRTHKHTFRCVLLSLFPRCEVTHYKTKSDTHRESTRRITYNEIFQYNWVGVLCTYRSELQNELYGMSGRCRKLSLRHGNCSQPVLSSPRAVICIIHYFAVRQTRLLSWYRPERLLAQATLTLSYNNKC
jgi:hypothetical protein